MTSEQRLQGEGAAGHAAPGGMNNQVDSVRKGQYSPPGTACPAGTGKSEEASVVRAEGRRKGEERDAVPTAWGPEHVRLLRTSPCRGFGFTLSEMGRRWCFEQRSAVIGCLVGTRETRGQTTGTQLGD